jgi:hypothetical protein
MEKRPRRDDEAFFLFVAELKQMLLVIVYEAAVKMMM